MALNNYFIYFTFNGLVDFHFGAYLKRFFANHETIYN